MFFFCRWSLTMVWLNMQPNKTLPSLFLYQLNTVFLQHISISIVLILPLIIIWTSCSDTSMQFCVSKHLFMQSKIKNQLKIHSWGLVSLRKVYHEIHDTKLNEDIWVWRSWRLHMAICITNCVTNPYAYNHKISTMLQQ